MKVKYAFVLFMLIFALSVSETFGQYRTQPFRRPIMRSVYMPVCRSARPVFFGPSPAPSVMYVREVVYVSRPIQEYPASPQIRQSYREEIPISYESQGFNSSRITEIERRLDGLERSINEIKNSISQLSSQESMSDEKYQRLLKVERDVANLKSILLEVREYLKRR